MENLNYIVFGLKVDLAAIFAKLMHCDCSNILCWFSSWLKITQIIMFYSGVNTLYLIKTIWSTQVWNILVENEQKVLFAIFPLLPCSSTYVMPPNAGCLLHFIFHLLINESAGAIHQTFIGMTVVILFINLWSRKR